MDLLKAILSKPKSKAQNRPTRISGQNPDKGQQPATTAHTNTGTSSQRIAGRAKTSMHKLGNRTSNRGTTHGTSTRQLTDQDQTATHEQVSQPLKPHAPSERRLKEHTLTNEAYEEKIEELSDQVETLSKLVSNLVMMLKQKNQLSPEDVDKLIMLMHE